MRILKLMFFGFIISGFLVGQAYSAPKGNNGKKGNNGQQNNNVNKGQAKKADRIDAQKRGHAAMHKKQARRNAEAQQKREARNRHVHNPAFNDDGDELAFNNRKPERRDRHEHKGNKVEKPRAKDLVDKINNARWWHHPHDERPQGNAGKVFMQDPLGHDKDSDRKEIYGNNGRPIHERNNAEEDPSANENPGEEVTAEEIPLPETMTEEELALLLDASIDFSSIYDMEWLVNWYEGTMSNYDPNDPMYEYYQAMWYDHFFPGGELDAATGIRLNNSWDESERYFYDISLGETDADSLIVTTTMTLLEGYTGTVYTDLAGNINGEVAEHEAGEVVYEFTEEVTLDTASDSLTVGITASEDLLDIAWGDDEVYVDLTVTIEDPNTGATYTQTYDQALYLYRCPYGKVTDERSGQTIVNAKVTVHYEDGSLVVLDKATNKTASNPQVTDATGRFGFILQTNRKYYLTANAEGYEEYKSDVFTEQWHVLREDIEMTPKMEQLAASDGIAGRM